MCEIRFASTGEIYGNPKYPVLKKVIVIIATDKTRFFNKKRIDIFHISTQKHMLWYMYSLEGPH